MSRRSSVALLKDMLDHAKEAVTFAHGKSRADIDSDRLLNLALVRLLEIIGEAASQIPKSKQRRMLRFPGRRLLACATDSSTATTTWTSTFSGKSSRKICHRWLPNWRRYFLRFHRDEIFIRGSFTEFHHKRLVESAHRLRVGHRQWTFELPLSRPNIVAIQTDGLHVSRRAMEEDQKLGIATRHAKLSTARPSVFLSASVRVNS